MSPTQIRTRGEYEKADHSYRPLGAHLSQPDSVGAGGTRPMTALKPLETLRVTGQPTGVYECNKACAHPDCVEPVPDKGHHIFPRSQIGNGLYFVQAWDEDGKEMFPHPIPHVTGLCRAHHDAVERHGAWIKLEEDGFVWYDRALVDELLSERRGNQYEEMWRRIGPLDPQPGGREKAHKPKRKRTQGEARRKRRTISVKVPADTEDGGALWDEMLGHIRDRLVRLGRYGESDHIPVYEALMLVFYDWLTNA